MRIYRGIETLAESHPLSLPTSKIALSLLTGFTFMLLVEQFTSHSHPHSELPTISVTSPKSPLHFDIDLEELAQGHDLRADAGNQTATVECESRRPERAYPLTLGLVMHGLADGLALGVSALDNTGSDLSLVVFFALVIHKGLSITLALRGA